MAHQVTDLIVQHAVLQTQTPQTPLPLQQGTLSVLWPRMKPKLLLPLLLMLRALKHSHQLAQIAPQPWLSGLESCDFIRRFFHLLITNLIKKNAY